MAQPPAPYQTGAVALDPLNRLVPVGSTIFIVELNLEIIINDTGTAVEPTQVDLYTGYVNDYLYDREQVSIWRFIRDN